METTNPYHSSLNSTDIPGAFAGRTTIYQYINQHFTDPHTGKAAGIIGRDHIGKSALLQHFGDVFDQTFIGIYINLRPFNENLGSLKEDTLLDLMEQSIQNHLAGTDLSLGRLDNLNNDPTIPKRIWFKDYFLPNIFQVIRPHRRVIFLVDDVDILIDAIEQNILSEDIPHYFSDLLTTSQQLGMVITLNESHADKTGVLHPLIHEINLMRLDNLTLEETATLLSIQDVFNMEEQSIHVIQRNSGGFPPLVQSFGYHLYEEAIHHHSHVVTPEVVKTVIPAVIDDNNQLFYKQWKDLSLNDHLIITSISNLAYEDPLKPITSEIIATWLIETDHPIDETTIKAAIRGLEYKHIIHHENSHIVMTMGMMQNWFLSHSQLENEQAQPIPPRTKQIGQIALILGVIALLIMTIVLASSLRQPQDSNDALLATVTLEQTETN